MRSGIFTFIFIVILLATGYIWYGYLQKSGGNESTAEEDFSKTLGNLARLKNLTIDTTLFQESFFTELETPREIPEPNFTPGRQNPFAAFR